MLIKAKWSQFFCLLVILSFYNTAISQTSKFRHFTKADGLPSNEVYYSLQDSKGYIWFSSDRGVSRYDGYSFTNYTTEDGLKNNTVFEMYEDNLGRIWFLSFSPELCYFENDKIHDFKYNRSIREMGIGTSVIHDFQIDHDTIFMNNSNRGYYWIDGLGNVMSCERMVPEHFWDNRIVKTYSEWKGGELIQVSRDTVLSTKYLFDSEFTAPWKMYNHYVIYDDGENTIMSIYNWEKRNVANLNEALTRYHLEVITRYYLNNELIKSQSGYNLAVSCIRDNDGNYWMAYDEGGASIYKNPIGALKVDQHYFGDQTITSITKDFEGGLWFTSLKDGFYYLPVGLNFLHDISQDLPKKQVVDITKNKAGDVFVSYSNNEVWQINNNVCKLITKLNNESRIKDFSPLYFNEITQELIHNRKVQELNVMHEKAIIKKFIEETRKPPNSKKVSFWPYSIDIVSDQSGGFFVSNNIGFVHFRNDSLIRYKTSFNTNLNVRYKPHNNFRADAIYVENGKMQFLASVEGVFRFRNDSLIYLGDELPLLKGRYDVIKKGNNNTFFLGSRAKGLIVWQEDTIYNIDQEKGLLGNQVRDVEITGDNEVWVATENGLNRINWRTDGSLTFDEVTINHGLFSNQITSLLAQKDYLFVGTDEGLCKLHLPEIKRNTTPPKIYMDRIRVNGSDTLFEKLTIFDPDQNQFSFHYTGLAYKNQEDLQYEYRLHGLENGWQTTQSKEVRYDFLPPGYYQFEIKVINEDGIKSNSLHATFEIQKPIWLRWWFITIAFLFMILISIIGIRIRENGIRRKLENQRRMIELELKALRSQMNPHFTFNTLSSIQQYILRKDVLAANNYIADFAALIRKVLENSKLDEISLKDELETIDMYLDLESKRFEGQLEYQINVDENIDLLEHEVPSMVIQPFVENAILHGVLPSSRKGHIILTVEETEGHLKVTIKDNGIGRAASANIKSKNPNKRKSLGMEITKERLNLIQKKKSQPYKIEISDLKSENGEVEGTTVEIYFPIKQINE